MTTLPSFPFYPPGLVWLHSQRAHAGGPHTQRVHHRSRAAGEQASHLGGGATVPQAAWSARRPYSGVRSPLPWEAKSERPRHHRSGAAALVKPEHQQHLEFQQTTSRLSCNHTLYFLLPRTFFSHVDINVVLKKTKNKTILCDSSPSLPLSNLLTAAAFHRLKCIYGWYCRGPCVDLFFIWMRIKCLINKLILLFFSCGNFL